MTSVTPRSAVPASMDRRNPSPSDHRIRNDSIPKKDEYCQGKCNSVSMVEIAWKRAVGCHGAPSSYKRCQASVCTISAEVHDSQRRRGVMDGKMCLYEVETWRSLRAFQ